MDGYVFGRFPYATVNYFRHWGYEKAVQYVKRNAPGITDTEAAYFVETVIRNPYYYAFFQPRKENMKWQQ